MSKPKEYRVCAFCGIRQHKSNLLRITLPDIFFDFWQNKQGRSFYVCPKHTCINKVFKKKTVYKYLDENPEDEHMQKQVILMGKSNICTIHSFCLEVIKNSFYEIDVSPNFRIGDQTEIELLKQEVLEELFELKYESEDKEFLKLINTYTNYRGDEALKNLILKIYRFIR